MASSAAAGNALRPLRLPRIVELLREQPLPAEVILPRLNRRLKADGIPEISIRTLQHDLDWMLTHLGRSGIERVARADLKPEPPSEFHRYRLAPGITVELVDATQPPQATPPTPVPVPALPEGTRWNERQVAIAARLAGGGTVRRKELEAEFGVSEKTLKRDLTMMKSKGLAVPQGTGSDHTWMAGPLLQQAVGRQGVPRGHGSSTSSSTG